MPLKGKDFDSNPVYLKEASGDFSLGDPAVMEHKDTNSDAILTALQAVQTAIELIDDSVFVDDTATHTAGTTKVVGVGAVATPTDTTVDANDIGMPGMSTDRRLWTDTQIVGQDATLTVDGSGVTQPVSGTVTANAGTGTFTVDGSGVTQPVSAASLPLPTGAATSANQLPDGHNVTVDNAVSAGVYIRPGTGVNLDTSNVTIGAALPAGTNAIGAITDIEDGVGDSIMDAANNAIRANIVAGSTAGTEYTEDAAAAVNPSGTQPVMVRQDTPTTLVSANNDVVAQRATNYGAAFVQVVDSSGNFINSFGGSGGTSHADDAAFTIGSASSITPGGFLADETTPDSVDEGDVGVARMTLDRKLLMRIVGDTDGNRADVDGSGHLQMDIAADSIGLATSANQLPDGHNVTVDNTVGAGVYIRPGTGVNLDTSNVTIGAALPAGTNAIGAITDIRDGAGDSIMDATNNAIQANIVAGAALAQNYTDDAAYTVASDDGMVIMGVATTDTVDANDAAALAIDTSRNLKVSIEVDNAGIGGGTQYTEDIAAAADPTGTAPILVRTDTPATITSTDGDNVAQRGTNYGAALVTPIDQLGNLYIYTEDAVGVANPSGINPIMRRTDTPGTIGIDGDNVGQRANAYGGAFVQVIDSSGNFIDTFGGSGGTSAADDADFTAGTTQATPFMGVYQSTPTNVTDGDMGIAGISQDRRLLVDAQIAGQDANLTVDLGATDNAVLDSIDAAVNGTLTVGSHAVTNAGTFAVQVSSALPAGTNAIGKLSANSGVDIGDVDILSVVPGTGATNLGKAEDAAHTSGDVGIMALTVRQNTAAALSGTDADYQPLITDTNGRLHVIPASSIAHDANLAGIDLSLVGLSARATTPVAVGEGDAVRALATLTGKQIIYPWAMPGNSWSYAAASGGITNTTGVTIKTAAGAGLRNYISKIDVINKHATVGTEVVVRDGASGTVLHRQWAAANGGGFVVPFDPPRRGTANTLVEVACITTGSATYVNAEGFVSPD